MEHLSALALAAFGHSLLEAQPDARGTYKVIR